MKYISIFTIILVEVIYCFAQNSFENDLLSLNGIENRIAGGEVAKSKQFPYQVRLEILKIKDMGIVMSICGGSLISDKFILTAAHCLEGASSGIAYLGTVNVPNLEVTTIVFSVWKKDFIVHENYDPISVANDIGLISRSESIPFNDAVQPIKLPPASLTNLDNIFGVISGFGKTGKNSGDSKELRFAKRKILPSEECLKLYPNHFRPESNVCVDGSENISACSGDSGGPLVISQADGTKFVVGITSFGDGNCDIGYPSVYTKVTRYLDWINKHTGIPITKY